MKNQNVIRLVPLLLLATTVFADPAGQKQIVIKRASAPGGEGKQINITMDRQGPGPAEMEQVTFLGVETMPVDPALAAQLGLSPGTGMVVRRIADDSPAEALLKQHDVLTKLDDQILVNMAQLSVLVRNHQVGDEVTLTYLRGGKAMTGKAKLGVHAVPKLAWGGSVGGPSLHFFGQAGPGGENFNWQQGGAAMPMMPGMPAGPDGPDENVMRVIGNDRMHWFSQPRVHVMRRAGGAGSTILDLSAGNLEFSDDQGSVEINATAGKRELTVKDAAGKVTFQGPINTPEEHAKLPAEVRARIDAIGEAELGADGGAMKVETRVLAPAAKIRFSLPESAPAGADPAMRSL